MADISASNWNEQDAANNSAAPNGLPKGAQPSALQPVITDTRGAVKRFWNRINAIYTTTGTAAALVITFTQGPSAYAKGERIAFFPNATNTGAMTLNLGTLGAKSILRRDGTALLAGDITAGQFTEIYYDGTAFRLVGTMIGNGSAISNLNASKLDTGTVADGLISGAYTGFTNIVVTSNGNALTLKSTGTGVAASQIINFIDSANTRMGYVGFGSGSNKDLYVLADDGNLRLQGTAVLINGNTAWHSGNFDPGTKANLTGGTFTGAIGVSSSSAAGEIRLVTGTSTAPGYMEFRQANGTRVGYIGSQTGTTLRMMTENGVTGWTMTGTLTATGDITAFSDARLKTNVETISGALDMVENMRGVRYDMNGKRNIGVIAQEFQKVTPELVLTADDEVGTLSVNYGNTVGVLIEAIKELKAQVDELKAGSEVR